MSANADFPYLSRVSLLTCARRSCKSVSDSFFGITLANSALISPVGDTFDSPQMQRPFLIGLWILKSPSVTVHPFFVIVDVHPSRASELSDMRPHLSFGTWRTLLRMRALPLGSLIETSPIPTAFRPLAKYVGLTGE